MGKKERKTARPWPSWQTTDLTRNNQLPVQTRITCKTLAQADVTSTKSQANPCECKGTKSFKLGTNLSGSSFQVLSEHDPRRTSRCIFKLKEVLQTIQEPTSHPKPTGKEESGRHCYWAEAHGWQSRNQQPSTKSSKLPQQESLSRKFS